MTDFKSKSLDFGFAKKHKVFIRQMSVDAIDLVCCESVDPEILMEVQRVLDIPYKLQLVKPEQIDNTLNEYYENLQVNISSIAEDVEQHVNLNRLIEELPVNEDILDAHNDAPVIKLLNALLSEAVQMNASDIHFEVFKNEFVVRFRVDGVLHEALKPPKNISLLLISRIKVLAKLDIAEKKTPQDGRINLRIANRDIDVRVSILPSNHGERAVLRILDKKNAKLDLSHLGAGPDTMQKIDYMIAKPNGIILVTGPTGSGKTTTLYGAINSLNDISRNILTVEDPIEYDLPGIGQTQVNPKVGMTFAKGLRAILRQDPDIIMVGEIRDKETADIAIEASLTGHLVLSTLHTNSAIGAIVRLQDMGIQPFLLASSLIGVVAQRLVRRLCPACKQPANEEIIKEANEICHLAGHTIYMPKGCKACSQFGYKGRIGIFEIIILDDTLRQMIHDRESEEKIKIYCAPRFPSLLESGCQRVKSGETSLEELLRVTNIDKSEMI